ncbi:site-specific integrase [Spirosoma migulaei]
MVYIKLVYNDHELIVSTGIRTDRQLFDHSTVAIIGNPEGTEVLRLMKSSAFQIYHQLLLTEQPISVELIRDALLGMTLTDPSTVRVSVAIEKHLAAQFERVTVGDIGNSAYDVKKRATHLFLSYLQQTYGNTVTLDEILPADANKFITWMKRHHKFVHNYAIKLVSSAKQMLFFAVDNRWIEHNPFTTHRNKKEFKMGEILTEKEVDQLLSIDIFAPALLRVRDVFAFQIYTGLSYRDVFDLRSTHIMTTTKGERYIIKHRQKTGVPSIIPLIPQAELLLRKYASDPYCQQSGRLLPVLSNQKMNNYLKQLGGIIDLKKQLSSHVARRTCATIFINNGVPINTVAKVLGHSSSVMTERHYAQLQPEAVIRDIRNFSNRQAQ